MSFLRSVRPGETRESGGKVDGDRPFWFTVATSMAEQKKISSSSTAEYFSKNLQQVGFSSPTKAVLTTLKEAVDNALDACEEHHLAPDIKVEI